MSAQVLQFVAMKDLPNRIREWRKSRKLSLEQVAVQANCSVAQLSDLERGTRQLNVNWMKRLAPILDVEPAQLLLAEQNSEALSEAEQALLNRYRAGNEEQRQQIVQLADVLVPWRGPEPVRKPAA